MKSSVLKRLIRECVNEILTEASLNRDMDRFLTTIKDPKLQTAVANYIVPFLRKSTDDQKQKLEYVGALRTAILSPEKAPTWLVNQMEQAGIDLRNPKVVAELGKLLPVLSDLQKFVSGQR